MSRIYRATSSFCAELHGAKVVVGRGDTIREGHPILVNHPGLFALLVPKFEHEAPKPPVKVATPATPAKKLGAPPAAKVATPSPTVASATPKGVDG